MLKSVVVLLLGFSVCFGYDFKTKYIDMPLDHFSFATNRTFKLKYLVNDTYYVEKGPIFFYTGNEGDISMFAQNTGFMFDIAPKFNALIVFAEHRYYGETLPFGNLSYSSPEYLGYLSTNQALADFVYLIDNLQETYTQNLTNLKKLPVIAFGGSYGGMLSAWLRMKYPYSVTGAIASSAPIWQFKGLVPCENYNKIVTDVFTNIGSEKCSDTIKKSWKAIRTLTANDTGKQDISQQFHLCTALKSSEDVQALLDWLTEIYSNLVMVNYPYPANFLAPLPANPVKAFCNKIDAANFTDNAGLLTALNLGLAVYTNYTLDTKCNNINSTSPTLGDKEWEFQTCTDMIMPMCSTDTDMFENSDWDFQKFSDDCFKQFSIRPRSENVPILEYGGKDLSPATNIVFSNGLLDPWSSGGVLTNVSSKIYAVLIPDGAHHFDLRSENPKDSQSVKEARQFHEVQIANWLDKFYVHNLVKPRKYVYYKQTNRFA